MTGPAVTSLLVDLLYLLHQTGIDPAEPMQDAAEIYETEQAEHSNT